MKYKNKVVWCLCLLLAGMAIVAVVPHIAHAATICNACKGTGRDICQFCGGTGCAQCNWNGGAGVRGQQTGRFYPYKCRYCGGTGKIYTAAEKAAMQKAAEAEKAKKAAAEKAAKDEKERAIQAASGTFTDSRDGKTYKTVKVGGKTWMAENLNFAAEGSKCYDNEDANCAKYGRLYNWETALKACPAGFHLPSDDEWKALTDAVGGEYDGEKKLRSTKGWDYGGTDDYGWSALPGGNGGSNGLFYNAGKYGIWWSATEYEYEDEDDAGNAWVRSLFYHPAAGGSVKRDATKKADLFSVRCVQDRY